MQAKKTFLPATGGAFSVIALGVALRTAQARRAAETSLVAMIAQREHLAWEIRQMESRLASTAQEKARFDVAGNRGSPVGSSGMSSSQPVPRSLSETISTDPRLELLELKRQRLALHGDYGYAIRSLRLSAEQIDALEKLWLQRAERQMDLAAAARLQDEAGKQAVDELRRRTNEEFDTALAQLLGAEGYRRWQEHERTVPLRNIVLNGLAGAAALEGIPLTEQQGELLIRAMLDAGRGEVVELGRDLAEIDWAAVEAKAQTILTSPQFALFKKTAPATSFSSRASIQLEEAIRRAWAADSAMTAGKRG
jgi:hypothetical protein